MLFSTWVCSFPKQNQILSLSHDANNDVCYALILEHELCFNISNIENEGVLYFYHTDSLYVLNLN